MLGEPSAALLIAESRRALDDGLAPGFPQKVAANALGIAQREVELGPACAEAERARLVALVGVDELEAGNAALCAAIRDGRLASDDTALLDHLIRTAIASVAVDQPGYPAFKAWQNGGEAAQGRT